MAKLPNPPVFSENGDYELPLLARGREHLMALYGSTGGGTVTLQYYSHGSGQWRNVIDGAWSSSSATPFEIRFAAPTDRMRLVLAGAIGASMEVTLTPIA